MDIEFAIPFFGLLFLIVVSWVLYLILVVAPYPKQLSMSEQSWGLVLFVIVSFSVVWYVVHYLSVYGICYSGCK